MWGIAETLAWMVSKECLDDQRVRISSGGGCVWQKSLSLIFDQQFTIYSHCPRLYANRMRYTLKKTREIP